MGGTSYSHMSFVSLPQLESLKDSPCSFCSCLSRQVQEFTLSVSPSRGCFSPCGQQRHPNHALPGREPSRNLVTNHTNCSSQSAFRKYQLDPESQGLWKWECQGCELCLLLPYLKPLTGHWAPGNALHSWQEINYGCKSHKGNL